MPIAASFPHLPNIDTDLCLNFPQLGPHVAGWARLDQLLRIRAAVWTSPVSRGSLKAASAWPDHLHVAETLVPQIPE